MFISRPPRVPYLIFLHSAHLSASVSASKTYLQPTKASSATLKLNDAFFPANPSQANAELKEAQKRPDNPLPAQCTVHTISDTTSQEDPDTRSGPKLEPEWVLFLKQ